MQVVIKIVLYRDFYTFCYVSTDYLLLTDKQYYRQIGLEPACDSDIPDYVVNVDKVRSLRCTTNALFLQPLMKCFKSDVYRTKMVHNLLRFCGHPRSQTVQLKLILVPPDQEIVDYAWDNRMLRLIWIRVEIENAFSYLSTLGGAYSALGDYFQHCAEEAGRISMRQYSLSKMLGDEALAARSKLYTALAIAQKGRLRSARHIVRAVNGFAIQTNDRRLNRMCLGVWAKLKYLHMIKHGIKVHSMGDGNQIVYYEQIFSKNYTS